jgi:phosphomannomutase
MAMVAQAISTSSLPAFTPFAAHCLGFAFATMLKESFSEGEEVVICIGRDPRAHGTVLADSFGRGAEGVQDARVVYTGIATTPAMFEFCR